MREITKIISVPLDGISRDFRLTKLDAFSGAYLLRMLTKLPKDGTYTLDDLLDIRELIRVKRENETRAREAREGGG